jgi:hypothetical protein
MSCKGSVGLASLVPKLPPGEDAEEGTAAHEAAHMILTGVVQDGLELTDRKMSNGVYVTAEMIDNIAAYVDFVKEWGGFEVPSKWSPSDSVSIGGVCDGRDWNPETKTLRIADLKYGWRIVEPFENWQLLSYGIGSGGAHEMCEHIELSIVQPRPFHPDASIRTWRLTRAELLGYYERIVTAVTSLDDTLNTGEHCRYCPALATCPAAREAGYNAVDVATRGDTPEVYDGVALATQLDALERAETMIKLRRGALEDEAKARIQRGDAIPGWWVKESLGNRAWLDGLNAETIEAMTGVDVTKRDIITPAEAERRGIDPAVVKTLTDRPPRGFKLCRSDGDTEAKRAFQG